MFTLPVDEEITLAPYQLDDAATLFRLVDSERERLRQYLPWVDKTQTEQDSLAYITRAHEKLKSGKAIDLGIQFRGRWVGCIGLNDICHESHKAEIGYWLSKDVEGNRIMTRSVKKMVEYAFLKEELFRLLIRCATTNLRSCLVATHTGFKHEGVLRAYEWMHDRPQSQHFFALHRPEWDGCLKTTRWEAKRYWDVDRLVQLD